jgi:uncharacterized protein YyaL (SSP411 family)
MRGLIVAGKPQIYASFGEGCMSHSNAPDERKANRLIEETSPYLQQHAYNPVDWYPWGDEALRTARELDRPIFLSVGYSSCHWCHVMEHESFENPDIAALMNESFINIKVDREERPDIDSIYMMAVQMLTGSGGWPMSVFLLPDLKPFWGGTYFPPSSQHGRPGFPDILRELVRVYGESRDKVEEAAAEITGRLLESAQLKAGDELPGVDLITLAAETAKRSFDPHNGGFGSAPKFPRPIEISMLLRSFIRTGDADVLKACAKTLECMALGGMYDQVGGGFHRYSTDGRWLVPHFEKMLYDNALLARTYLEAYQLTKGPFYRQIASDVCEYVLREMTDPAGGFYSATDADSDGAEGKFFVWTPTQVREVLGEERARVVCEAYNITEDGNFEGGTSIPHVTKSLEEVAKAVQQDAEKVRDDLQSARRDLYEAREARPKPFRDEKIITAWNGLMVSALARAYCVLGQPKYREAAERAMAFVKAELTEGERLRRTYKSGKSQHDGYLDDYAYLSEAALDLYEATFDPEYLREAVRLMRHLLDYFWDAEDGGFFYTSDYHESVICRKKDLFDNATPAGAGVATLSLLRLERLTGDAEFRTRAEAVLRLAKPLLERAPMALGAMLIATDFYLQPPLEVALVGALDGEAGRALRAAVHEDFVPRKIVAGSGTPVARALADEVPLLRGKEAPAGGVNAFVCLDYACKTPTSSAEELRALLSPNPGFSPPPTPTS